ncbi:MAG: hypothetical protein IJ246_01300 [Clostridia bacterium]|nr:hypothetical protein [Clostridia bacterium]
MQEEQQKAVAPLKEMNPIRRLRQAIASVRGENTHQLVESFTSEMTMVAEGLCEDQSKLRSDIDALYADNQKLDSRLSQDLNAMLARMDQQEEQIRRRMDALEEKLEQIEKHREGKKIRLGRWQVSGGFLSQITRLVSIGAGAWVLVTLMHLIQSML